MWPEKSHKPGTIHPTKGDMQSAITNQPTTRNLVQEKYQETPDGLDELVKTQHLFIKQSGLPIESYSSVETQYEILNSDGEKIFMADETTDTTDKAWCRGTKPFEVSILIRSGMYRKEVMKINGEPRSCGCGGDIKLRSTKAILGTIEQGTECSYPHYFIRDTDGQEILQIVGPSTTNCFNLSLEPGGEFEILSPNERMKAVGKIAKYSNGKDATTKKDIWGKDIWGVKFPLEMKVTQKALMLAACFLLNFQYQNVH